LLTRLTFNVASGRTNVARRPPLRREERRRGQARLHPLLSLRAARPIDSAHPPHAARAWVDAAPLASAAHEQAVGAPSGVGYAVPGAVLEACGQVVQ